MKRVATMFVFFLLAAAGLNAQSAPPFGVHGTIGDSPPTTSFSFVGNVDLAIDVIPFNVNPVPASFVIAGIPAGATVQQALMYVQRWNAPAGTSASAVFDGNALGPIVAHATDPSGGFQLQAYRFDVTGFVAGNGTFPFTFTTSGGQNYYAALVVVYSHASVPSQVVIINDGSEAIGTGSSTTSFVAPLAGAGTLTIVTQADNAGGSNESIVFNGSTVAGPGDIFNANLGSFASFFQVPVTVLAGANTAAITTSSDLFGWHLAILVGPANRPPDCSNAAPSVAELWPPNHKFDPITITGVTDPDGDPVTIKIDSIFQDEPVDTFGDGSHTPDATGVGTDTADLRAERSGTKKVPGNGRVYHITFTADDGNGGTCSATVTVCVPHDQGKNSTCVDDGALYDSTVP